MVRISDSLDDGRVSFALDEAAARRAQEEDAARGRMVTDPVCGKQVRTSEAAAASEHDGRTFYFCSHGDKDEFDRQPERYVMSRDDWDGPTLRD